MRFGGKQLSVDTISLMSSNCFIPYLSFSSLSLSNSCSSFAFSSPAVCTSFSKSSKLLSFLPQHLVGFQQVPHLRFETVAFLITVEFSGLEDPTLRLIYRPMKDKGSSLV